MAVKPFIVYMEESADVHVFPFDGTLTLTEPSAEVQALLSAENASEIATATGLGSVGTINLSGDSGDVLYGDGTWAPGGSGGGLSAGQAGARALGGI